METSLFEFATLKDADEEARLCEILCQTFRLPPDYWQNYTRRIGQSNLRVLRRHGRVAGGLAMYHMGQWFGGRCLDCAGIAAVGIAPEDRSAGAAAHMMTSTLLELYEQGVALSSLYPSTQRLYRKFGYEQAGSSCQHQLPLASIGLYELSMPMTRLNGVEHEPYHELARARASVTNGNLERSTGMWERAVTYPYSEKTVYRYLIGPPENPEGYLFFHQDADGPGNYDLRVRDMVALTPSATRTLWAFLSSHRTVAGTVTWPGPAVEPLLLAPVELKADVVAHNRWMLRLVNVRKALLQRGYPSRFKAELHFDVADDIVPGNTGRFVLRVADGSAEILDGGRGDLRASVGGLSPLFSGFLSPAWLRNMGQIEADDPTIATATSVFSGPPPWMPDAF